MGNASLRSAKISAVSVSDFARAVRTSGNPSQTLAGTKRYAKIGLCVSGGPDSMALASLFAKLRDAHHEYAFPPLELHGFIIDHGARKESAEEASLVSEWLDMIGVLPHVLNVRWNQHNDPSTLSRFETEARSRRLALIMHASQVEGISDLFAGHHRDDQAETVMMRMLANHSVASLGLVGIRAKSTWPRVPSIDPESKEHAFDKITLADAVNQEQSPDCIDNDDGRIGIGPHMYVNHPLLSFSKESLIKTCDDHGIKYAIDQSNFVPSLTMRNSCRHIIANYRLPRALQTESLCRLATHAAKFEARSKDTSNELLRHTNLRSFDLRLGTLVVRLPSPALSIWDSVDFRVLAFYLRRLVSLISPGDSSYAAPFLRLAQSLHPRGQAKGHDFRRPSVSPTLRDTKIVYFKDAENEGFQAVLGRQLPRKHQVENYRQGFSFSNTLSEWSSWELFDQRFFIRVRQPSFKGGAQLGLRFLNQKHLLDFQTDLCTPSSTGPGEHRLNRVAKVVSGDFALLPQDSLFTIPVIYDMSQGENSRPLAIPTLGICGNPYSAEAGSQTAKLDFQVLYKNIDTEALRLLAATNSKTESGGQAFTR